MCIVMRTASPRPVTILPQICTVWCTKLWKHFNAIIKEVFYCFIIAIHLPGDALDYNEKKRSAVAARMYSGFNFSHYDLPFPTHYCIPYVRSGLSQLVIRVKGFRVCAFHCVRANDLDYITHCIRFCPSAWTPHFQRVEFLYR